MFLSGFLRQSFELRDAESLVREKNGVTLLRRPRTPFIMQEKGTLFLTEA